jgi:hypothetical protein
MPPVITLDIVDAQHHYMSCPGTNLVVTTRAPVGLDGP